MKINVEIQIDEERIKNLLVSAFEGGSNYWYVIDSYNLGETGLKISDFAEDGKMQDPDNYYHYCQLIPFVPGCSLVIADSEDDDKKEYTLDRAALIRGLSVMATKYPKHFADFMVEDDDATTGDVYLQCCLFGEAIYG